MSEKPKAPNLWTLGGLAKSVNHNSACIDGEYVPARPLGMDTLRERLRLAWGVFRGRYDALQWPRGQ